MRENTKTTLRVLALLHMALDEVNLDMQLGNYPKRADEAARKLQRNLAYVTQLGHDLLEEL